MELLTGSKDQLIAPLRLRRVLGQDQEYDGETLFHLLRNWCKLRPDEKVLDVGSGVGRVALPLTSYLNQKGEYEGLEIIKEFVEWCQENISAKYPNFRFKHANVLNRNYNPNGKFAASQYKFPYEDESFDLVFLYSVFTHMLPKDLENYLSEISRVMKKNGRCLITFFLLNAESQRRIKAKRSKFNFFSVDGYSTTDKKTPEKAVAYMEEYILKLYQQNGLEIVQPIHYGSWSGRKSVEYLQDAVVAIKRRT